MSLVYNGYKRGININLGHIAVVSVIILNLVAAVFVIQAMVTWDTEVKEHDLVDLSRLLENIYNKSTTLKKDDQEHQTDVDQQNRTQPSLEFLSLLKPVSHFSGLDFEEGFNADKIMTGPIRNWANSEGSERTLCYNDMTYQNGSITVPAAGVYHITSHVKFYVEDNRKNDNSQTFHHQIFRYSAFSRKQVVLFENVVTECREGINDGAHLEYPSLTGGLAQLDAGDHVIVRVSHFDLLKHDRDWHYFDMYLI